MAEFDVSLLKNPLIFKQNVLPAHSAHVAYKNKREFLEGENSLVKSLDGVWKFSYAKNYQSTIIGFEKEEYDCRPWNDIRVPAHIQMEGYDIPQYVNVQYPWDGREAVVPGEIPKYFNPVASYVKYFEVPEEFKGKQVRICFKGVESGMALWLNGTYVGYSEDSFTPSDFDLTPYLKDGENKLAVQVFKWTSSSWCEDQDFFRFSGIYRSVFLYAVPKLHVEDVKVITKFEEDDFTKAVFHCELKMLGSGTVKVTLKDQEEIIFCEQVSSDRVVTIEKEVMAPKLWSAEAPNLYELELEAVAEDGETTEYITQNVGFRKIELKNGRMLLNGKRVVFKGVNRHEFSSISGRCVSEEELRKDLRTMKRNNINAIRTCHYPDDARIYELCDIYGIYLIAECNMETHGSWDAYLRGLKEEDYLLPGDKEEWEPVLLDRVVSCYERDKNHPAILLWSCGNESYGGKVIYHMSEKFRELDPYRLVHYEGIFQDRTYNDTSDVESRMYPSVEEIKEYLANGDGKPFVCCEYSHAMGNSCGAIFKYTDLADEENSQYQGGFIWDYIDQSIYKKDRYGKWFQAYGGDFSDRPSDYNFSGNGIAYGGEREESPKMQEVKFVYQNIAVTVTEDQIEIWNKHLFVNTDAYQAQVILQRNGEEIKRKSMIFSVEPESKKTFELPIEVPDYAGEYVVTVSFHLVEDTIWAKAGHEIAFGQAVVKKIADTAKIKVKEKPFEVIRGENNIGIRGENFDILFSGLHGGLASYRYAGKEMIMEMPRPNFWRAPIDNDGGNQMQARYAQWKIASMYLSPKGMGEHRPGRGLEWYENPLVREEKDYVVVTYRYGMPTTPVSECQVEYKVYGDGRVQTTLSYDPVKELADMPEFGMMFKFDADYDHVEWYGNGPQETYEDRKKGAKLGIYRNKVADNMAKYLVPQECGNHTDVRYAKVTDLKGRGMLFSGDAMNFSALPYTPHEMENAMHDYELPEVHYTVVRVAKQQMGIGGDDSWGARVHPEFLIDTSEKIEFTFTFKGI